MKRRAFLAGAAALVERPGAALPLDLPFTASDGRAVRLRDHFDGQRAVLLVPGYWRCPQLCGLLMQALLQGLEQAQVARNSFRIVGFSIDPGDTPASAQARRANDLDFARFLRQGRPAARALDLDLLVGHPQSSARLAEALGVRYAPAGNGIEHPAVVAVATPQGRVSRYLPGLAFDAGELRVALAEARGGRIGAWSERVALFCSHLEPSVGRYDAAVLNLTRATGLGVAAVLGAWCWRRRGGRLGR